jgi:hypothetical protein
MRRLIGLTLFLAGCQGLESGAKEQFGSKYSCPADRVTAKQRSDLRGSQVLGTRSTPRDPPDEVKRDPARLAKWNADREKERSSIESLYDSDDVFEVSGCDHTVFMGCHHPRQGFKASCREGHAP